MVFEDHIIVSGMTMLNGYTKSAGTYTTNNKIKSYTVEIYTLKDGVISVSTRSNKYGQALKNRSYKNINGGNYYQMLDVIVDDGDPTVYTDNFDDLAKEIGTTSKIRIYIDEVFKGSKYDDTCISELLFYGLSK